MDPGLSTEEIDRLVSKLKRGESLEDYYRPLLFREVKEVELAYAAKQSKSEILSSTMAVPLQPLKRYGETAEGHWTNKLVVGDNLQVLKTLLGMKNRGELKNADGSNGVRLCYIDPPFATKREFRGGAGQRAYRDKIAGAEFVEYLRKRLVFIYEVLAEDGALYVHLDWKKSHYIKVVLDEIFGESNFRNELVWHYKFRLMPSDRIFNRKHDTILFYAKSKQTWLRDVSEEWTREAIIKTRKQAIYTDDEGREWIWMPGGKGHSKNKKKYLDEIVAEGKALSDVWDMPIISSSAKERTGYPTQKPEALIERIIRASSDEGDLVLDCFSGSGTTAAVAERLGRRWIANDAGKLAITLRSGGCFRAAPAKQAMTATPRRCRARSICARPACTTTRYWKDWTSRATSASASISSSAAESSSRSATSPSPDAAGASLSTFSRSIWRPTCKWESNT
jgi:DNA modification methylase